MYLSKRLIQCFARKIRVPTHIESLAETFAESAGSKQSDGVLNIERKNEKDTELEDEFEPLSYDHKVQQAFRDKVVEELLHNPEGEDPNPHKLVNRPSKGAAWGLGGQLILADRKVQLEGLKAELEDIIDFLELNQVKNIYVHDFHKEAPDRPETNRKRYHLIGSCFSSKHCWKTGIELKNAFNLNSAKTKLRRKIKYDPVFAMITGGKSEEWILVDYKDYEISLMTEEQREASDLEWKWNNEVSDETLDKHMKMKLQKKGRKNQFDNLD